MANTQINITSNGTKTLATAGKYCDRNIDVNVNVPVPSGYIKPSGSKTITTNGTHDVTQYASAVVNVETAKPTQFTNLYDPANVQLSTLLKGSSSGASYSTDNNVNCILIPFHHKKGEPVVLRMRGIGTVRDRYGCVVFAADGTTRVQHYNFVNSGSFTLSYDEHGDAMITFAGGIITNYEWYWFGFNFQYVTVNSGATAMTGPIITINEPIGNGGHV